MAKGSGLGIGDLVNRRFSSQHLHGRSACAISWIDGKELGAMAASSTAIPSHLLGVPIYESKSGINLLLWPRGERVAAA